MGLENRTGKLIAATLTLAISLLALAPVLAAAAESGLNQTAPTEDVKQARMMQETMIKMHEQLHKIMETRDPAERERLKQEQLKTTQEFMKNMRASMGEMKGPDMMGAAGQPGAMKKPADK